MQKPARLGITLLILLLIPVHLAGQNKSTLSPDKIIKIEELIRVATSESKIPVCPSLSLALIKFATRMVLDWLIWKIPFRLNPALFIALALYPRRLLRRL
jgi:hypothetical protein